MIKLVAFVTKRSDLDRVEFLRIWRNEHAELVWALPGVRRYVQSASIPSRTPWPYDGMAEIWFDSKDDVSRAYQTEAADRLRAHEPEFVTDVHWFLTEEREVAPPTHQPKPTSLEQQETTS